MTFSFVIFTSVTFLEKVRSETERRDFLNPVKPQKKKHPYFRMNVLSY